MIRVVIPAYKTANTITRCLDALYRSLIAYELETVIIDDGDNGDLNKLLECFPVKIIEGIKDRNVHFTQYRKSSVGVARNRGASGFAGEILVFLDADVEVHQDAITLLTSPIFADRADATIGNYSKDVRSFNFAQKYKQLYIEKVYSRTEGYTKNEFWTGLAAIKTKVFNELGGFKEYYFWLPEEDTELGIRLTQNGKRILSVPVAFGKHLKSYNIRKLILNDLQKGTSAFSLALLHNFPVNDCRHATWRDITAVFGSCSFVGFSLFHLLDFLNLQEYIILLFISGVSYLYPRADLLSVFRCNGKSFFLKSIPMMFFLDIVRGLCVILGLVKVVMYRLWLTKNSYEKYK